MTESEGKLLEQLHDVLKPAIVRSWNSAIEQHPGEYFYGYVLFTSPLLEYIVPSFSSEESLNRVATESSYNYLRWSPDEWEYYLENESFFDSVQKVILDLDQETNYQDTEARNRRWNVIIKTLIELDSEELFGTGEIRNKLTVNIMWGDQDAAAHTESARQLNPRESYLQFARYQLPWLQNSYLEIEANQSRYSPEAFVRVKNAVNMVQEDLRNNGLDSTKLR